MFNFLVDPSFKTSSHPSKSFEFLWEQTGFFLGPRPLLFHCPCCVRRRPCQTAHSVPWEKFHLSLFEKISVKFPQPLAARGNFIQLIANIWLHWLPWFVFRSQSCTWLFCGNRGWTAERRWVGRGPIVGKHKDSWRRQLLKRKVWESLAPFQANYRVID